MSPSPHTLTLESLAAQVERLRDNLVDVESRSGLIVPITSFAPEPFEIVKEIRAVLQEIDDEYLATFFDANVGGQGDTPQEAIDNLKDLLLSRFDRLEGMPTEKLGKSVARQIAVLREFIRRKA